jgi:hypothetical protein
MPARKAKTKGGASLIIPLPDIRNWFKRIRKSLTPVEFLLAFPGVSVLIGVVWVVVKYGKELAVAESSFAGRVNLFGTIVVFVLLGVCLVYCLTSEPRPVKMRKAFLLMAAVLGMCFVAILGCSLLVAAIQHHEAKMAPLCIKEKVI